MARRWGKLEKDFLPKSGNFDISKVRCCQAFLLQILVCDQDTKKVPKLPTRQMFCRWCLIIQRSRKKNVRPEKYAGIEQDFSKRAEKGPHLFSI
jgi:hypothetical protein